MKQRHIYAAFLDDVNGVIVGGFSRKVALIAPNGKLCIDGKIDAGDDPEEWGKNQLDEIKDQKCGDGKSLSFHKQIFEGIYGKGDFSMRIYD